MATVTKTIGTTGRDYSTIAAWEADLDEGTIYGAGDDAVAEIYNDSAFDETVIVNGGSTIGLNSIKMTVPSGERHDGTAGSGARVVLTSKSTAITFNVATAVLNFTLEWLELDDNSQGADSGVILNLDDTGTSGNSQYYQGCIIHGAQNVGGGKTQAIENRKNDAGTYNIQNNFIYAIDGSPGGREGFGLYNNLTGSSRVLNVQNCTVHDIAGDHGSNDSVGFRYRDATNNTIRNCISTNVVNTGSASGFCYDPSSASSATVTHNLSSDATASGTGSLTNKPAADQFVSTVVGSEDLHLKSGADAIDAATDLGTTPTGVNIDIDGRDRDAEGDIWDMGAHEFVGVAPPTGGNYRPLLMHGVG